VCGHPAWVGEIWANYLSNAIKYGGTPPEITVGCENVGNMVRYRVADNGEGIAEARQAELFRPLPMADMSSPTGHGLGLSIVTRIIEKLGGSVGVDSMPGQGSTFWFMLPASDGSSC
jgi:signal transduction histidine kinase